MSDQLICYHIVLRQTKRYWRTIFYHLLEIAVTNAFVIHNGFKWKLERKPQQVPASVMPLCWI